MVFQVFSTNQMIFKLSKSALVNIQHIVQLFWDWHLAEDYTVSHLYTLSCRADGSCSRQTVQLSF